MWLDDMYMYILYKEKALVFEISYRDGIEIAKAIHFNPYDFENKKISILAENNAWKYGLPIYSARPEIFGARGDT